MPSFHGKSSAVALFLASGMALAAPEDTMTARFDELDANRNGALELGEIQGKAPMIERNFQRLDANHDGKVTREEMQALRDSVPSALRERANDRFKSADANGDGVLSKDEVEKSLPRVMAQFSTLDKDGNGVLSREELLMARQERLRPNDGSTAEEPASGQKR